MIYNGSDKHKQALFENKQDKLTAGDNISLTPQQDGTVRIDASGGSGTVTDVLVDGVSVVNQDGEAEITMPSVPSDLDDLSDVNVSSLSDGEVLKYNATTQKWENGEAGGGNVDDVEVNGESVVDTNKVAQVFTHKEVTRAQYDALPDSKYSDGIIYCITDGGSSRSDFYSPIVYSLAEREVGVWCDGKPLYQKTISCGAIPNTSTKTVAHNISDIDFIVSIGGSCSGYSPIKYYPIPLVQHSASLTNYQVKVEVDETNITISTAADLSPLTDSYVTIRYTKTTDNQGTGRWAQDGVPAHHYSTDEKVIGTWIDGSTLYEKTFVLTIPNTSGDYLFPNTAIPNWNFTVNIDWTINGRGSRTATPWITQYTMYLDEFSANGLYFYFQSTANAGLPLHVTVQYTKSS